MNGFPIKISLGKKEPDVKCCEPAMASGEKCKPRTYYPSTYIDNVPGMEVLAKEGFALIKYRRKRLSIEENYEGKETTGATLDILEIHLPESADGDMPADLSAAMDKMMKSDGAKETDDEDEEE